jgi:serine/threonine protein kinase
VYKGTYKGVPIAAKYLKFHVQQLTSGGALRQILGDGACKPTEKSTQKNVRDFQRECDQLKQLKHKNIVRHIATLFEKHGFPVLVMELMTLSLRQYLKSRRGEEFSLDCQFHLCIDICEGLAYLRQEGLVHRDLCADNVLIALVPDNPPKAKITDVGLSKIMCGDLSVSLSVFTKRKVYVAPEGFEKPYHYEYSLDMYAFGVLVAQIIRVNYTMNEKTDLAKALNEISDDHPLNQFILNCLSRDRKRRPKAAEAVMYLNMVRQHI